MSEEHTLKLTNQCHSKRGMSYDFRRHPDKITVRITPRESASDTADWRIDASDGPRGDKVFTEWGATKREALVAVANTWMKRAESEGLPLFDWDAITQLLVAVRAL